MQDAGTSWNPHLALITSKPPTWMTALGCPTGKLAPIIAEQNRHLAQDKGELYQRIWQELEDANAWLRSLPSRTLADKPQCCDCNDPCPAPTSRA